MEQIGAGTRITLLRNLRQDRLLCFAVCHSVSFAFQAPLDSHEDMRAVRGNGSYGRDASKEQYSICTGIGDIRKFLEESAHLYDRSDKAQAEVTRKLIFHSGGDFFESCFHSLGASAGELGRNDALLGP